MKTAIRFAVGLVLVSSSIARDFLPEGHLENVPASDTSIQQCYIFRTVPGVQYRVESSHDLNLWTAEDELYGIGNEFVVPMREFTPPPPPPPGTGIPVPPPHIAPARLVGLRLRPSSGASGGTVVSWRSLDDDAPVNWFLAQTMAAEWLHIPIISQRYGNYYFNVSCSNMTPIPPPAENPQLGPKDAAMYAQFEASFPAMNQSVIEATARARNMPPPAPPDPLSRKFWRVYCDWGLDTDQDGTPDWMEFETEDAAADGLRGDAFVGDTNGNGIPDGDEMDYDKDGVADAQDPDAAGGDGNAQDAALVTWKRTPGFQFAAFELPMEAAGSLAPEFIHLDDISENGAVLFTTIDPATHTPALRIFIDRNLSAHEFPTGIQPLTEAVGDFQSTANALLGDDMLGILAIPGQSPDSVISQDSIWNPLAATPATAYTPYSISNYLDAIWDDRGSYRVTANVYGASPLLQTPYGALDHSQDSGLAGYTRIEKNGNVISYDGYWRFNAQNNTYGTRIALPEGTSGRSATLVQTAPGTNTTRKWTLAAGGSGLIVADGEGDFKQTKVTYHKGQTPVGVSSQGWLATTHEIWNYDKWRPLTRFFSGMNPEEAEMLDVLDTGLSVARLTLPNDQPGMPGNKKTYRLLPIQLEGSYQSIKVDKIGHETGVIFTTGAGVDDVSCGADSPDPAAGDRIWIMAPQGNVTEVTLNAPLNPTAQLTLSGMGVIKFGAADDITISQASKKFTLRCVDGDPAPDGVRVVEKLGTLEPANKTLYARPMKHRNVKVTVYKITRRLFNDVEQPIDADMMPTKAQMENHLNNLFKPQVNADFSVDLVDTPVIVNWDANHNGVMDAPSGQGHSGDQQLVLDEVNQLPPRDAVPNIRVFIVSSRSSKFSTMDNGLGMTFRSGRTCWIMGSSQPTHRETQDILDTIGHEIGHVLVGDGHPDVPAFPGPVPLEGTDRSVRLMASGSNLNEESRVLVKGEWDEVDRWMKHEEDEGRLP